MLDGIMGAPTIAGSEAPTGESVNLNVQPGSQSVDTSTLPITGAGGKSEQQIVADAKTQAENNPSDILKPAGVEGLQRGPDGRFVGTDRPNATKPNQDFAKQADPDESKGAAATTGEGAEGDEDADPASTDQDETWSAGFAKAYGLPVESISRATKVIADDFGRVLADIEAGRITPKQAAQQQAPATDGTGKAAPGTAAAAAPATGAVYSPEELALFSEDNFDADSARMLRKMAETINSLNEKLTKVGNPDEIAQRAAQEAETRVTAAQQQAHTEKVQKTIVQPFFSKITKEHPELAGIYGGKTPNLVQREATRAFLQAAGAYMQVKAQMGTPITERQALDAAFAHVHADILQQSDRSNERRASATITRHRSRDISGGRASSPGAFAGEDRMSLARTFLASTKNPSGHG